MHVTVERSLQVQCYNKQATADTHCAQYSEYNLQFMMVYIIIIQWSRGLQNKLTIT